MRAAAWAAAVSQSGQSCCFRPTLSRYAKQTDRCCLQDREPDWTHSSSLCLQFDKVQESFFSLEQQTSTFQAHLEGLGKGTQGGSEGPVAPSKTVQPPSGLKQAPGNSSASVEHRNPSTSGMASASSDSRTPLSLRERSALHFSSTLGRLRRSGKRKWEFWFNTVNSYKRKCFQMLSICRLLWTYLFDFCFY